MCRLGGYFALGDSPAHFTPSEPFFVAGVPV